MPQPAPETDASLVAAYRRGDQRAAASLVHRHGEAVSRYLASAGADPGAVEDLVQESFFRAFRRIDSWRGEASFRGWLLTIAGNLLRDEYRKHRGRVVISIDDREIPGTSDPGADFDMTDALERLAAGLGRLPRLQREVFIRRAQEGMAYDDIAAALGTTAGAARVHYHQAVKRLKELLG